MVSCGRLSVREKQMWWDLACPGEMFQEPQVEAQFACFAYVLDFRCFQSRKILWGFSLGHGKVETSAKRIKKR